jgi:hypothetical protein
VLLGCVRVWLFTRRLPRCPAVVAQMDLVAGSLPLARFHYLG